MKATDLFNSPNAPYTQYNSSVPNHRNHEAPADIFNALRYKTLPSILTEKNIGDPRWREPRRQDLKRSPAYDRLPDRSKGQEAFF